MKRLCAGALSLLLCGVMCCGIAWAQPNLNNAGKGENPANRNAAARAAQKQTLKNGGGQALALLQRDAKRREQRMERMPRVLLALGVTDTKTQDAIIDHLNSAATAYSPVLEAQMKLRRALAIKATTDAQVKAAMDDVRSARKIYEATFQKSLDALDKKISYTKSSRLEGALLTIGVLDPDGINTGL